MPTSIFLPSAQNSCHQPQAIERLSFLDLPTEIRLQIYAYTIDPKHTCPSSYIGLYTSCRLIKRETDHEYAKLLWLYLLAARDFPHAEPWLTASIHLAMPTSFARMRHLCISVASHPMLYFGYRDGLHELLSLHLDSLTIRFHEGEGDAMVPMDTEHSNHVIHRIDLYMRNRFVYPAPRVVVLDLGTSDRRVAIVWVRVPCGDLGHSWYVPVRHWAVPKEFGEEFPCVVVGDAVWDAALCTAY